MGCGASNSKAVVEGGTRLSKSERTIMAVLLIQRWYRRYVARMEARRRCVWSIFQKLEYASEQDELKLQSFFSQMLVHCKALPDNTNGSRLRNDVYSSTVANIVVPDDYRGTHVQLPMSLKTLQKMIISFKQGEILHCHYALVVLTAACNVLQTLPNVTMATTHISKQITICGDLHGNLDDLLIIFHKNGLPDQDNPYVFNGDFVDRGENSVEVAMILFALLLLYPSGIFINRGNHEDHVMNLRYGFINEIKKKYPDHASLVITLFNKAFCWLPVACVINNQVLVVHGGISPSTDLKLLSTIDRHKYVSLIQLAEEEAGSNPNGTRADKDWKQVFDILWSDPRPQNGSQPNTLRGGGVYFGPDVTERVLQRNNLSLLVRSHECKLEGYELTHSDQVITIFSASNYYQQGSNKGAYLKLGPKLELRFVQFVNSNVEGHLKLSLRRRVSVIEESALKELREHISNNRTALVEQFTLKDPLHTGLVTICEWAEVMEAVLQLGLPWLTLKQKLAHVTSDGRVEYMTGLEEVCIQEQLKAAGSSITEAIYRNRTSLETIFRLIDKDNSGYISLSEFESSCQALEQSTGTSFPKEIVHSMASAMDINKDGIICFNEFLESFRLCSIAAPTNTATGKGPPPIE